MIPRVMPPKRLQICRTTSRHCRHYRNVSSRVDIRMHRLHRMDGRMRRRLIYRWINYQMMFHHLSIHNHPTPATTLSMISRCHPILIRVIHLIHLSLLNCTDRNNPIGSAQLFPVILSIISTFNPPCIHPHRIQSPPPLRSLQLISIRVSFPWILILMPNSLWRVVMIPIVSYKTVLPSYWMKSSTNYNITRPQ